VAVKDVAAATSAEVGGGREVGSFFELGRECHTGLALLHDACAAPGTAVSGLSLGTGPATDDLYAGFNDVLDEV